MDSYTYIIFAVLLNYSYCENCALSRPEEDPIEKKLNTALLYNYDYSKQPNTNNTEGVEASLDYLVQMLTFDDTEEILTIYSWNIFKWTDDRLKWDPDKYKGIKKTIIDYFDIWTPGLKLKNENIKEDALLTNDFECEVNHTGNLKCIQMEVHSVVCISAMKHWPYDTKHCILKIDDEAWLQRESNIVFTEVSLLLFADAYSGWEVVDSNERMNLTGDYQATIEFVLERMAVGLEASIVIPSIVISTLTLTSLLLSVKNSVRLGILCVNLLSHYLLLIEINERIPKYSPDVPVILLFIRFSMALTLIAIILTFSLKYFCSFTAFPPLIITSINTSILNSYGRYFVFPMWNVDMINKTIIDSLNQQTEWVDFSNIINSTFLIICCIIYIIMYSIYMPRKIGVDFLIKYN